MLDRFLSASVAIGLLSTVAGCDGHSGDRRLVEIYFIPFDVGSNVPITRDKIEFSAFRYGEIERGSSEFRSLQSELMFGGACSFNEDVHAKIVLPDPGIMLVDTAGCVEITSSGAKRRTWQASVEKLGSLLRALTGCELGSVGCDD